MAVADNDAGRWLEQLKEAYEAGDVDDVLYIAKGIHLSIAPKDVQAAINAIALEEQKAKEEEDRREAQSNRALILNKVTAQLQNNSWTISGNKSTQLQKLIAGEKMAVKTKNKKTLYVKLDGSTLKQVANT